MGKNEAPYLQRILLFAVVLLLANCSSPTSPLLTETLARPISCPLTRGDIALLEAYRPEFGNRLVVGATAIIPFGAVAGVLSGTEGEKLKYAAGTYNREIDKKIAAIRQQCELPDKGS